jgi:cytohesin
VAASKGNADIVEALVDFGCDKDAQDKKKRTPLHLAIENGHLNVVESLLGKEVDLDAGEEHDWTALHLATIKGNEDIVDRLLETGKVKQELPDADYHTALYYAVIHGHRSIAVRLGERLENSNEFVIFLIEHHEKRNEMLGNMAENGTLEAVKLLLEVGADVNSLNSRGSCNHWTPLHLAAGSGHLPVVEFLISKDANKDAKCYCYGYTPISYARNSNQMHIVEYLESV